MRKKRRENNNTIWRSGAKEAYGELSEYKSQTNHGEFTERIHGWKGANFLRKMKTIEHHRRSEEREKKNLINSKFTLEACVARRAFDLCCGPEAKICCFLLFKFCNWFYWKSVAASLRPRDAHALSLFWNKFRLCIRNTWPCHPNRRSDIWPRG